MKRSSIWLLAFGIAVLGGRATAHAQSVGLALANFDADVRNYNLISLGNASFNGVSDTQMGIAIGGNLTVTNNGLGIANQGSTYGLTGDPTLYLAGSMTVSGGENVMLNSGYASTPGLTSANGWTWNSSQNELTDGSNGDLSVANATHSDPVTGAIPSNWNWNTITNDAKNDSKTLANASSTVWTTADATTAAVITGSVWVDSNGNLEFGIKDASGNVITTAPAAGSTVIFNYTPSSTLQNAQIVFDTTSTNINYVVNVLNTTGSSLFNNTSVNMGSSASTIGDELLWNIEGTGTVSVGNGNFYGSILAPTATISSGSTTYITGQVLASSYVESGGELHYDPFSAVAARGVVPESAEFAVFAVGLAGLAIWSRRRLLG